MPTHEEIEAMMADVADQYGTTSDAIKKDLNDRSRMAGQVYKRIRPILDLFNLDLVEESDLLARLISDHLADSRSAAAENEAEGKPKELVDALKVPTAIRMVIALALARLEIHDEKKAKSERTEFVKRPSGLIFTQKS